MDSDQTQNYKFAAIMLGLLYCFFYISTKMDWHFIDAVDLIIHEAGHVIFSMFGYTLFIAGGSLLQVIVPLVFSGYFIIQKAFYSATATLYWAGINLVNVSVYAGDAVRMQLPLLTGDKDGHDWNQLMISFGLLHHAAFVSNLIFITGIIVILIGFIIAILKWLNNNNIETL